MSTINEAAILRFYLDTQEYSDRLTAIETQAASALATQKSEVAAAIAQVNLTQSQTITALTIEVSNLNRLTDSITATQAELINLADQLAQDVTDTTVQLTQDKATFTQEIQDALDYLKDDASVASALRTPRKINGTDFDGRSDITTNAWGATRTFKIGNKTNSINGTSNVDYSLADIGAFPEVGGTIQGNVEVTGNLSVDGIISATLEGTAARADKLQVARKIQGVDFDGTQDINLPIFSTQIDGLVPKRVGATSSRYLREDGTWEVPSNTAYALLTQALAEDGTATTANTISAKVLKDAIQYHAPPVTDIVGNAGTATKLQTPRTINGISFDGTQNILLPEAVAYSLPTASASVLGGIKVGSGLTISNSVLSVGTLNQSTTGNAATSSKLQTSRTISLTGNVTGSASFDGSANASITTAITGLGVANGIATLDSNGQVPSTQLPSYVDDVLEYTNVTAFPTTGVAGKIYVETIGNTTYRWGGTSYVKITSGDVASVAGKTGVVTLSKADVGLSNVDNTSDASKSVASASKLTTAYTIGGVSFNGTANINLPGVNTAGNQNTSGSAASLTTARTLSWTGDATGSFSFNGTANASTALTLANTGVAAGTYKSVTVNAKGLITAGTDAVTGLVTTTTATGTTNAATANNNTFLNVTEKVGIATASAGTSTQITGAGTITVASDTAGKITITGAAPSIFTTDVAGLVPARIGAEESKYLREDGTWVTPTNTTYTELTAATANDGTETTAKLISASVLKTAIQTHVTAPTTITGNAESATKLETARKINGIDFNGTADITITDSTKAPLSSPTLVGTPRAPTATVTTNTAQVATTAFVQAVNKADTGSAATAIKLKTARTIGGVPFDGTTNIDLLGVNIPGNQNTAGNAATASKLANARTINGVAFDGTANITVADSTKLPLAGGTITGSITIYGDTYHKGIQYLTKSRWKSYKDSRVFGTTYLNYMHYEREVNIKSDLANSLLLSLKVTFTDLNTNESIVVYFGSASNGSGGIYCAECFTVPPYTSYKAEVVRADSITTIVTLNVLEWWERDYVA